MTVALSLRKLQHSILFICADMKKVTVMIPTSDCSAELSRTASYRPCGSLVHNKRSNLFDIGHQNLLRGSCSYPKLYATTDLLILQQIINRPVVRIEERVELVSSMRVKKVMQKQSFDQVTVPGENQFKKSCKGNYRKRISELRHWKIKSSPIEIKIGYLSYAENISLILRHSVLNTIGEAT